MTTDDQFLAELQSESERIHQRSPDADRPPDNLWNEILVSVSNGMTFVEEHNMTALTMPQSVSVAPAKPEQHRLSSRLASIVASMLIIATLAFGGWFAAMQTNDSGTPTPNLRFAAIATPDASGTPQANTSTCDIEPLSVDRVMEIVEHPGYFMTEGAAGERSSSPGIASPPDAALWELDGARDLYLEERTSVPSQDQFDSATDVANHYMNCMTFGTQGQVWNFYSPVHIQASILAEFPVYANETDVRARVEERLVEPAYTGELAWDILPFITEIESASVNPDRQLAILQRSDSYFFDQVMLVGVSFKDADGNQMVLTNGTGRDLIPNDPFGGRNDVVLNVTIARIQGTDTWLIIPGTSGVELGL